jgi:hypothetical protein
MLKFEFENETVNTEWIVPHVLRRQFLSGTYLAFLESNPFSVAINSKKSGNGLSTVFEASPL